MPIEVKCTCGKRYKVADHLAGKLVFCPNCKLSLDVPAPDHVPTVDEVEVVEEEEEETGEQTYGVNDPIETGVSSAAAAAASNFGSALGVIKTNREAKCLAYSMGNKFALAGMGRDVLVIDARAGKKMLRFDRHDDPVTAVAISPNTDLALSGDRHGDLFLWELQTGRVFHRLPAHRGPVEKCAIAPNGRFAVSGGEDGVVRLWDLKSGQEVPLYKSAADEAISALTYSHDGAHILAGGDRGRLSLWSVQSGERLLKVRPSQEPIEAVAFSIDNTELVAASFSNSTENGLIAWRYLINSVERIPTFTNPSAVPNSTYFCLTLTPNGRKLVVGAEWKEIIAYTGGGGSSQGFSRAMFIGGLVGAAVYASVSAASSGASEMQCGLQTYTVEGGVRSQKVSGVHNPAVNIAMSPDGARAFAALQGGDLAFFAVPP